MAEYLSPGVYVEEFDSGEVPMEGISTSTAGFIGIAEKGPKDGKPLLVTNFSEFRRVFGGYLSENQFGEYRYLSYAVNQFFTNGGSRCYIKRVVPTDATYAHNVEDESSAPLVIYAKDPGAWGNKITVLIKSSSKSRTQVYEVIETSNGKRYRVKNASTFVAGDVVAFIEGETIVYNRVASVDEDILTFEKDFEVDVVDTNLLPNKVIASYEIDIEIKYGNIVEKYEYVSLNYNSQNYITDKLAKSDLVIVDIKESNEIISPYELITGTKTGEFLISLFGGTDGTLAAISATDFIGEDNGPGERTGINSFIDNNEVSIISVPGVTDPGVQMSLIAHCENLKNRFAILDIPRDKKTVNDILEHRNLFDSDYAAMYHPWVKVVDPITKNPIAIPPSGSVCGIFARSDANRGVHKAPANEVVSACIGLDINYTTGEQDILNPKGVNLIKSFVGQGIRVWGARTLSSNGLWKYINVRRLFIFVEESIRANTNWVVFEPNDQVLWLRVRRTIEVFLANLWRNGALAGSSESEAFFVDIGPNTMSKDDIDNGRLICVIGLAPVKPAEFVIFRLTQKTSE